MIKAAHAGVFLDAVGEKCHEDRARDQIQRFATIITSLLTFSTLSASDQDMKIARWTTG
jgi:hypothetical protein